MPVKIVINDPDFPPYAAYTVTDYAYGHQVLRGCDIIKLLGVNLIIDPQDAVLGLKLRRVAASIGLMVDGRVTPAPAVATIYATHGLLAPDGKLWQGDHNLVIEWLTGQTHHVERIGYIRLRSSVWEVAMFAQYGNGVTDAQYATLYDWFELRGSPIPDHVLKALYRDD